jgi:hypothetical protein
MRPGAKAATLLVLVLTALGGAGPAVGETDLLGRWHLDASGSNGQVVDDSGHAHDGTASGSGTAPTQYIPDGRFGSALRITQSGVADAHVMITGDTSSAARETGRDHDLRVVSKPIDANELLAVLRQMAQAAT